MAKKDKYAGMADMFEQHTNEKIRALEEAKARVQAEIDLIEHGGSDDYSSGQGYVEDRNEINALNNELRHIEQQIAEMQSNQK